MKNGSGIKVLPDLSGAKIAELVSLRGRSAVVTGGARGLGRAIADRLAEAGADTLIGDLDVDEARTTAAAIAAARGAKVSAAGLDVRDGASLARLAETARETSGGVDIWVNNAGIFPFAGILELSGAEFDRVLEVNLRGVFNGARAAAAQMIAAGRGGVIVNIVSVAGFVARSPGVTAYAASKHGVRGLTSQLAIELAPHGIRVLGVAPGFCTTEGTVAALPSDVRGKLNSRLGRVGVPDDIARVVLFCASGLSAFMTGSTLVVDGGEIA